jgi:hypothetical protein
MAFCRLISLYGLNPLPFGEEENRLQMIVDLQSTKVEPLVL